MEIDKVLTIKGDYNDFEKYYLSNMNRCGVKSYSYFNDKKMLQKIRQVWTHMNLPFESIWYNNWKKILAQYNLVIVFDSIHNSKILKYILKNVKNNCRVIFWHWNPINDPKETQLFLETKLLCEHWTFDVNDHNKFGMKLNSQFYFWPKKQQKNLLYDVFYIGQDKGRYEKLYQIYKKLTGYDLKLEFKVLKGKTPYPYNNELYIDTPIQYTDIIETTQKSRVILELVQSGQKGLTTRALEALFYQKKLITDNKIIKEMPFYNPNNIFVIENMNLENIKEFLKAPYVNPANNIISYYSCEAWIGRFSDN